MQLTKMKREVTNAAGVLLAKIRICIDDEAITDRLIENGNAGREFEALANALSILLQLFYDTEDTTED